ncbi:MAG TPA: ABC transporter permease subunit, partial [Acidimicrobiales bacterium]|nr:ABC transporter permease subunit [Acidimicrobiales bacterium]
MALTTLGTSRGAIQGSVAGALRGRRSDVRGRVFEVALLVALLMSLLILATLIWAVLSDGLPVYSERGWAFLDGGLSGSAERAGISQGIIGSFWIAVAVVVLAVPLGIGAAVYLEEYAPRNALTAFIEVNVRNLAGVPSVVYGLLGLAIFVNAMDGFSTNSGVERRTLAAAGVTLAVLVLPIMIITTSEALRAVPSSLREASLAVGATRWETIRHQVL